MTIGEAFDEIERLEAENARLRELLKAALRWLQKTGAIGEAFVYEQIEAVLSEEKKA